MSSVTIKGASVILHVNGKPYAEVSSFDFSSATPAREIRGIDNIEVLELAVTTGSCSGAIGVYRLIGSGGAEGIGISTAYDELPALKYVMFQLIERLSDTVIFQATQARLENQGWSVAARGLMTGHLTFKALNWNNEVTKK